MAISTAQPAPPAPIPPAERLRLAHLPPLATLSLKGEGLNPSPGKREREGPIARAMGG